MTMGVRISSRYKIAIDLNDKIAHPFIVPSTRCTCVMIMLFNQILDMPHLSGGQSILAKEKYSLTGI